MVQVNINGRAALVGMFAAASLVALTAAQLPALTGVGSAGGYIGLHEPHRVLWRFDVTDQIATGEGYTVPPDKELVVLGVGAKCRLTYPSGYDSNGQALLPILVNGQPWAMGAPYCGTGESGAPAPHRVACEAFPAPGLAVSAGDTLSFGLAREQTSLDNQNQRDGFVFGYLRDI